MRAIQVSRFGGPEVLAPTRLPDPSPGPDQLVLRMAAADVIFLDPVLRSGAAQEYFPQDLPYVPGSGGAGTVIAVGAGLEESWLGTRVVARAEGSYAETVVAGIGEVVPVPPGLGLEQAAALVHDGVTALGLDRLGVPAPGEWVLVMAAAGGAGSLLVQLVVEAGARVVAAASSDTKRALARDLGAEAVVDYTRPDWIDQVRRTTGTGAALVYDGAGGSLGTAALAAVADHGRLVTYGTAEDLAEPDPALAARRGIDVVSPLLEGPPAPAEVREALGQALRRAAQGRWRPAIGATYPLERAAEAHRALEARATVGKSLLLMSR